jgi:hypothetical protein
MSHPSREKMTIFAVFFFTENIDVSQQGAVILILFYIHGKVLQTLLTCLVHVGAGVADGGYGKLVLQPQPQHILKYEKNVLRQTFKLGQTHLF